MRKTFIYLASIALIGMSAVSCSKDEDGPDGGSNDRGESVDLPIPSSIVNGTRVESTGGVNVNYNNDGSISSLTNGGMTFNFVYDNGTAADKGTRAVEYTGKKLTRIVCKYYDDVYEGYNFKFNDQGFLTEMTFRETEGGSWGSETLTLDYKLSYDGSGRLTSNKMTGNVVGEDEDDGKYNERVSGTLNFSWNGGNLTNVKLNATGVTQTCEFTYGTDANTFNLMIPHMAGVIGAGLDPILAALSMIGFTGNGPAMLPVKMVEVYRDEEDNETDVYEFRYTFNSNHSINSLSFTEDGTPGGTFHYRYYIR